MKQQKIKSAMEWLADQKDTIFLGQNICYPQNQMYQSLIDIPKEKKIEMPVAEDMQMGISIGLALQGYIPISIYPRMDFLILAINQLVNHLDKIEELSHKRMKTKVIIRTMVGGNKPLNPGCQHSQDYCHNLNKWNLGMLRNVLVDRIKDHQSDPLTIYKRAYEIQQSIIIVEN